MAVNKNAIINPMTALTFSAIDVKYLPTMCLIETSSNPLPWKEESLHEGFHQFQHIGAFLNDQLIAFILYSQAADETEIIHVVCDKNYQKKGYTKALFKHLLRQFNGLYLSKVFLEVREHNKTALSLYQHLGFREVGRRSAYYKNKEDAIVMKLLLKDVGLL